MKLQKMSDITAISLSIACIVHCLFVPIFFVLFPALTIAALTSESFHMWLLLGIFPISVLALTVGYMQHHNHSVLLISVLGLIILLSAPWVGHVLLEEYAEIVLTVVGASIVAIGHFRNFRLGRIQGDATPT